MKKKVCIVLILLCMCFTQLAMGAEFSDVPQNHWAYKTISELTDKGIVNGMGDGTYSPDGTLTRGQFIKLLTCGLDEFDGDKNYKPMFFDTPQNAWYTPYVTCGAKSGIISFNENLFYPDSPMTRGEAAVWIVNGIGVKKNVVCGFLDVTDPEQKKAIAIAQDCGIINGYEDGSFRPDKTLTRAEAAALISRTMDKKPVFGQLREDAKNEIVLKENIQYVEIGENNKIKKADEKQKTLTFASPSEEVKNLKKGDILYIPDNEKTGMGIVKVTNVRKSGSDIIVSIGSPELSDVLESIDISAVVTPSAEDLAKNDYVSDIKPVAGARGINTNSVGGLNIDAGASINPEAEFKDGKIYWKIPAQGSATSEFTLETPNFKDKKGAYASLLMSMNIFLDVNISGENFDGDFSAKAEVASNITATAGFSASKEVTESIELPAIEFSVAGPITVEVTPYIVATASGEFKVEATASLTNTIGCEFKDGEMTTWSDPKMDADLDADAEGFIEIGPEMVAELGIIDFEFKILGKEFKIDAPEILNFTADMGLGINGKTEIKQKVGLDKDGGEYAGHQNTPDENGVIHHCSFCVKGEIYSYDKFSFGLSDDLNDLMDGLIGKKLTYESDKATFPFSPWYYSVGEWGKECELANCPHKLVRVSGNITEKDTGEIISGANVSVESVTAYVDFKKETLADIKSDKANSAGRYEMFLEPGGWNVKVTEEAHKGIEATIYVSDDKELSKDYIMELKDIKISGFVKDSKTGEAVSGAKVVMGEKSGVTGADGYYELEVKPKDTYTCKVTCDGYFEKSFSLEVKTDDITQNISLEPDNRWQEAYRSIIKKSGGYHCAELFDFNLDGIPELLISWIPGSGLFSNVEKAYTYKNGKAVLLETDENLEVSSTNYKAFYNNTTGEWRIQGNYVIRGGWAYACGYSLTYTMVDNRITTDLYYGWDRTTTQVGKDYVETYKYYRHDTGAQQEISKATYDSLMDSFNWGWTEDTTKNTASIYYYSSATNSDINELFKNYENGTEQ